MCEQLRVTLWMNHLPSVGRASYRIVKLGVAGNARNVFPRHPLQKKPLLGDPGMHLGTCVTHLPWCMSGSLTRGGEENVTGIPGACATRNFTYLARGPWSSFRFQFYMSVGGKVWYGGEGFFLFLAFIHVLYIIPVLPIIFFPNKLTLNFFTY